ncbi:MAG: GNAT family N-acetyltransferase [Dysgonamonadaceae bacterium]|jgi:GNAT superfamily N-acetyltransferase|nr:GNAT family N-acetyltransferase [Dysgonamonadaceae bacterium]
MQNIIIRRAKKQDCPRLLELVKELAKYEKASNDVTITPEEFIESGFGEKPVWWAFVAETKGVIHGMALYYIRFSTWKGQQIYLEDIYVSEEMRGNGIGSLLFDQLIIEAKEKEFKGITWQVLEWNESAIHFYKKYHILFDPGWINCRMEIRR